MGRCRAEFSKLPSAKTVRSLFSHLRPVAHQTADPTYFWRKRLPPVTPGAVRREPALLLVVDLSWCSSRPADIAHVMQDQKRGGVTCAPTLSYSLCEIPFGYSYTALRFDSGFAFPQKCCNRGRRQRLLTAKLTTSIPPYRCCRVAKMAGPLPMEDRRLSPRPVGKPGRVSGSARGVRRSG